MQIQNLTHAMQVLAPYIPAGKPRGGYKLAAMRMLMAYLGNPQEALKVIHVAGTSGKTSTAYYARAILEAAGCKTGLTVSPHIYALNERVQIGGRPLPDREFCDELGQFLGIIRGAGLTLMYFEILTAFAYWEFARQQVDYAVVEVGLGGLLDCTNVIDREDKVCVITDIGLDHVEILGHTIGEIAAQKAGIIQPRNQVFMYDQGAEVMSVVHSVAERQQATLHIASTADDAEVTPLPLFQQRNYHLAKQAAAYTLKRDNKPLSRLLNHAAQTYIPARMETLKMGNKTLILDGAHNAQKLHALMESVRQRFPRERYAALVAFSDGNPKRLESGLRELVPYCDHLIFIDFSAGKDMHKHAVPPEQLVALCRQLGYAGTAESIPDITAALHVLLASSPSTLLVTGSFYFMQYVRPLVADQLSAGVGIE